MAEHSDATNAYVLLLIDEAGRARTEERFDELCDRIERILGIDRPITAFAGLVDPRVSCPHPGCEQVLTLAEFRAHLETHVNGAATTVKVESRRGWAPPRVVVEREEAPST